MGGESTVVGSEARGKLLTGISLVAEVDTDGGPFLPNDIGRGLRDLMRGLVPSLLYVLRLDISITANEHIISIEVGTSAVTNRLTIDQDIEFEARVLMIVMTRGLEDGHILEQQDRELDRIHIEGKLDTLGVVVGIPVAQTHGSQLAVGHGLSHATGTGFVLGTVEVDNMTALDIGGTVVHRSYLLEVVEGKGILRRRVVDIADCVVEVEIVHAELVGIVDQLGRDGLEAEEVIIALSTHDEVRLSDRQSGEVGLVAGYDLRSGPRLSVVGIGADLILGSRTLPLERDGGTVGRNDQVGRLRAGLTIGDEDIVDHSAGLLCLVGTVGPSEGQVVGRAVALRALDLHGTLTPGDRTTQIVHISRRLETDDIVGIAGRHHAGRGSD